MSVEQDQNPFAAPTVQDNAPNSSRASDPLKPHFAWFCMFVINLPVPLYFGFGVTSEVGRIGMPLGIAAVYLCGVWSCTAAPRIMYRLNIGSSVVAVSQFLPMLHVIVGIMALSICQSVFGGQQGTTGDMTGIAEITSATILTGIGLIIPSVVFGTIIVAMLGLDRYERSWT